MKYFFNEILINNTFQLFLYAINISKKSRIIRNNKEYIHIYFYLSISKIYFFPNLALTGSFSILRCIVGYLHRKIGQKSLLDKRILQYPFKNFCRSKYVEKQCLNIFFFPSLCPIFLLFHRGNSNASSKVNRVCPHVPSRAVTYRPPITIDSTVTNQPPKLREQSRTGYKLPSIVIDHQIPL